MKLHSAFWACTDFRGFYDEVTWPHCRDAVSRLDGVSPSHLGIVGIVTLSPLVPIVPAAVTALDVVGVSLHELRQLGHRLFQSLGHEFGYREGTFTREVGVI